MAAVGLALYWILGCNLKTFVGSQQNRPPLSGEYEHELAENVSQSARLWVFDVHFQKSAQMTCTILYQGDVT